LQTFIPYSQQATPYVLLKNFMQFVAVKAKIWWNNKGSSFIWNTVYILFDGFQWPKIPFQRRLYRHLNNNNDGDCGVSLGQLLCVKMTAV